MTKAFIVAYDLRKPVQNYPRLWAELERLGAVRLLASDWLVVLNSTARQVAEHFVKFVDSDDRLLVTEPADTVWYNLLIADSSAQQLLAG
jgi:hypothetical protein